MPGPLLGALHTRPTLFFKTIDWSRYKENLCFYDDIERLRNLTNIQLGIGSRNCILVHDETLGGRVNVRINKWLCKGGEVKPMNAHNQPSIPDWKENSLLHSDVKKTRQNLQFKWNPKVYHVKTFMWKKSPACSLFSTEWTFPRMLGIGHSARWWERMQHLGVTDSDVQISTIWAGPNSILLAMKITHCFWRLPGLRKLEHRKDLNIRLKMICSVSPGFLSPHNTLELGFRISVCCLLTFK